MATYLDKIIEDHRERVKHDGRNTLEMLKRAADVEPCLGFRKALQSPGVSVISEIKRKSPSKGDLNKSLDPAVLAGSYQSNGASCISVLTDKEYFSGSLSDLDAVRSAVSIPILRKDFTVSAKDVLDARLHGADAVLLIVAALSAGELGEFFGVSKSLGMDVLVEVHDEAELRIATALKADLIGVNQRDLTSFEVDPTRAITMAPLFQSSVVKVCESGIVNEDQMQGLARVGYDAVLIGEALVRSPEPGARLNSLVLAGQEKP